MNVQLLELMEDLVPHRKKLSINFSKASTNFCLRLHYNADNTYLFVKEIFKMEKKYLNLKPAIIILISQFNFLSGAFLLLDLVLLSLEKRL